MGMVVVIVSQSLLWAAASVLLVIAPGTILSWFDLVAQVAGQQPLARVFGAELAGLTLVSYFTRHLVYTPQRKSLAVAYTVSNTLGFVMTSGAIIQGSMGGFVQVLSGLYLIYALAFAYYLFLDRKEYLRRPEGVRWFFE